MAVHGEGQATGSKAALYTSPKKNEEMLHQNGGYRVGDKMADPNVKHKRGREDMQI